MATTAEDTDAVSTLIGTPEQAQARLRASHARRVLLVEFIQPDTPEALAENLAIVASSMPEALSEHHGRDALERLARELVPREPASPRLLREASMLARARNAVLKSGDWLTAMQIAELAGLSQRNPSAQPNKWKKQGLIFAIHHRGVDYFPGYGLNRDAEFRPLKLLSSIIKTLSERKDGWGMAYWFLSENGFLGGKRPQDLLASAPERVLEAALNEVSEISHG